MTYKFLVYCFFSLLCYALSRITDDNDTPKHTIFFAAQLVLLAMAVAEFRIKKFIYDWNN